MQDIHPLGEKSPTQLSVSNLREQQLGIEQSRRRHKAHQVSETVRPVLRTLIDHRLMTVVSNRAQALPTLTSTGQAIADLLQVAVLSSLAVTVESGKRITRAALQNRVSAKQAAVSALVPSFNLPPAPANLSKRWADPGAMITGSVCLVNADFTEYRDALIQALTDYAEELVASGLLGFVVERGDLLSSYAYVLRTEVITVDDLQQTNTVEHDPTAPLGSRNTHRAATTLHGRSQHATEEHVHWLANATVVPLPQFSGRMPQRVSSLVKTMPDWLSPYLSVVEGKIILDEVHTMPEETYETEWVSKTEKVWKASPAMTMGDLVLAGWSDDDLARDAKLNQAVDSEESGFGGSLLLGAVAVGVAIWLFPGAAFWVGRKVVGV